MKAFYIRRSLRIFPLYFAFTIVVFLILPFFVELKLPNPFYYFFFLSNFDVINTNGAGMDILNISWSVSVEEQFYLAWAIIFAILTPRHYLYLFLTIITTSALFRWTNSDNHLVTMFHTFSVMSDLAIGGLSAYLVIYNKKFKNFFENLPRWIIFAGYAFVIPMLMFSRFFYLYTTFGRILLGLGIAFIIIEQNYSNNSFYQMKNRKMLSALGKYTYGLYLLHPLVIFFVAMFAVKIGLDTKSLFEGSLIGIFSLLMSVFVCYLSYRFFESPFLKLKSRFAYLKTYQTNYRDE
jgi:peptidoglycan/LPS O-acetylase OafA/YrhL